MKHHILCIDDEIHNLEALERLLRKEYKITIAESGPEALEKLKENKFSLIISDQKMPEMTGVEFFQKAITEQPEAIRILLTGYTDLESVIGAINQGQIYRYITKPWDPEELKSIVAQAIEVYDMKKTIRSQNDELQKANKELQSLDQLKTDFMLLVNHELKTPLTAIFSFTQLLNEENLNEEHKLYVEKIIKNTNRLQTLINDTLLITKLKSQKTNIESAPIDIGQTFKDIWETQQKEFSKKILSLDLKNADSFTQKTNHEFLKIILTKLIINGFTHAKSDSTIEFEFQENENQWTLITKNQLSKKIERTPEELLNSFSRNEKILNHSGGAGLGLAVIQSIVKLFSGKLELDHDANSFCLKIEFPK